MKEYVTIKGDGVDKFGTEATYHVLTQSSWPIINQKEAIIPPSIGQINDQFETYYKSRN